ncbi:MAG: dephospho-CoA kinase, partial [Treponema sp.]|nr:dephospho-CoA kinase [Treponema sp.]
MGRLALKGGFRRDDFGTPMGRLALNGGFRRDDFGMPMGRPALILIGLTGGYCAGKNTVAEMLERRGWTSIDVDRLGHQALEIARDEVVGRFDAETRERFGRGLIDAEGRLDRKLLGAIVFSDPRKLAAHEAIIHPV